MSLDPPPHLFFAPVFRGDSGPSFPTGTILVRFDDGLGDAEIVGVLNQLGMGRMERRPLGSMRNAFVIATGFRSGISALELANRLALRPEVVAAEVDMVFGGRSAHIPNDPNFSGSWGLHNVGQSGGTPDVDIDAPEAWDRTLGSPSILTMILDTGVQQDHPDLHQLPGIDLTGEGTSGEPVNSCDNHGTAVAGILGSTIDNGLGTAGAAPGAWIVSARTFISEVPCTGKWTTDTLWTVDALDWAISAGVRVTNNSNFYGFESSLIASKYQETRDVWGMTHFASAGNSAIQHIEYPAALPTVHAITAIDSTGTRASFSSWGPETSFTGPGEDLFTTDRTGAAGFTSGDYAPLVWGTSFSCPMAACVAALLLSEAYSLDPDEVDELLRSSAVDLGTPGWDQFFGWGLPNAAGALQALDLFFDDFESGNAAKWSASKP